ncbi:LADA_0D09538g1_1 [Lachancea dasiensis]|uniref:LADA_0D09538g1_1 n=1 Tax=Lachancea dasiensis TaxID=1072105 RepID=A0A1G4J7A0_9SACH|nr:LADA_0D09538g1_1 [Lachancea dasiensis]
MSSKQNIVYQPTDIVLAKVKGFPAWPAMIVPEEIIPVNVLKGRPGRATVDEVEDSNDPENYIIYSELLRFRKNFKPHTSYCVKFFCDDSYIWVKPVDFRPLTPEQCTHWLQTSKKKTKKLIPAYEMAEKGSRGIDVWEFIEYGSKGKPEEDEYIQPPENDQQDEGADEDILSEPLSPVSESDYEEGDKMRKGSRVSKRQAEAKAKTNAKRSKTRKRSAVLDEEIEEDDGVGMELLDQPQQKSRSKKKKAPSKTKPEVQRYKFEDDGDWSIVGLGPQDSSITLTMSSLANKLSQKRNLEIHNEIKADLRDKLAYANRMINEIISKSSDEEDSEDYHMLVDELEQCAALRGSQDELITVFLSDQEIIINLTAFFNLKQSFLREIDLYDRAQQWYFNIFGHYFVPDPVPWSWENVNEGVPLVTNDQKLAIDEL